MSDAEGFASMAQDCLEIESAVRVCAGRDSTGLSGVHLRYRQGFFKKDFFLYSLPGAFLKFRRLQREISRFYGTQGRRGHSGHNAPIHGTADAENVLLSHMGINHRRFDARMPKKLLHRSYVASSFQEVGRKAVAERMDRSSFSDIRTLHRLPKCFL